MVAHLKNFVYVDRTRGSVRPKAKCRWRFVNTKLTPSTYVIAYMYIFVFIWEFRNVW